MAELKPCPFCGAKETDKDQPVNIGWVIEAWNKRVPQIVVNQHGENCTHISNCGTLNLNL